MFDACPTQARFDLLEQIRRFFLHHGPDLAQAVSRLGGAPAKQRLARCMTLRAAPHVRGARRDARPFRLCKRRGSDEHETEIPKRARRVGGKRSPVWPGAMPLGSPF